MPLRSLEQVVRERAACGRPSDCRHFCSVRLDSSSIRVLAMARFLSPRRLITFSLVGVHPAKLLLVTLLNLDRLCIVGESGVGFAELLGGLAQPEPEPLASRDRARPP